MGKKIIIILLLFLLAIPSVFAGTIILKSGKTIEAKILEKTQKYIRVDMEGIPITYYIEDIKSIDGEDVSFGN